MHCIAAMYAIVHQCNNHLYIQCKSSRVKTFPHYFARHTVGIDLGGATCVNKLRMHAAEERVTKTSTLPSAILEIWSNWN